MPNLRALGAQPLVGPSISEDANGWDGLILTGNVASHIFDGGLIDASDAFVSGQAHTLQGSSNLSQMFGSGHAVSAGAAFIHGINGNGSEVAQYSQGNGAFAVLGDAQYTRLISKGTSTNGVPIIVLVAHAAPAVHTHSIPNNTSWQMKIAFTAIDEVTQDIKTWEVNALVSRGGAGTANVVTGLTKAVLAETTPGTTAAWDVSLVPQPIGPNENYIQLGADQGATPNNVRWLAVSKITELGA